jgi:hypothetical protein
MVLKLKEDFYLSGKNKKILFFTSLNIFWMKRADTLRNSSFYFEMNTVSLTNYKG